MLVGYPPFYGDDPLVTCRKILCWRETLQFPQEASISHAAEDLIRKLLCDREHRLGRTSPSEIQTHPFFAGVDWENLRTLPAPFKPDIVDAEDTSYFDKFDEEEPRPEDDGASQSGKTHDSVFLLYNYRRYPSTPGGGSSGGGNGSEPSPGS